MLKKLIIIMSLSFLFSQDQSITNITVGQLTDGSGLIEVTYDLIDEVGTFASFNVEIQVSIDDSEFEVYSGSQVSGDVGENVIPGVGRIIYIQAPDETYSSNVVVKIIASAYTITSELPFTMITISSVEGVSSYQDESISYSYEIMQNEMTNAELVTFLETYDFQLDADEAPTYNCNDYTEYFNTGYEDDEIYGCMDTEALNYNPYATFFGGDCIYEHQIGCTDESAANFESGTNYNDCSCWSTNNSSGYYLGVEFEQYDGSDICNWDEHPNCNWVGSYGTNGQQVYHCDTNADGDANDLEVWSNYGRTVYLCDDDSALNYPSEFSAFMDNLPNEECINIIPSECYYDCDESYLDIDTDYGYDDYGNVNIQDFSTQAISFEGSSFVIESGLGTQPAIFNYENCVDGVVVGLLIDHYGLRIPTGGEWTKAAREDNTRCWPWLESDCDTAAETYCNSIYECMSDEEFEACEDEADGLFLECQLDCNSDSSDTDCADIDFYDICEDTDGCTWDSDYSYCQDSCYACMVENQDNGCSDDPCAPGCECCTDCMGGGDMEGMMECMNECGNTYGNTWDYCNGQDVQDCENCMMNTQNCEGVDVYNLAEFLDEDNYDDDDGDGVYTSDYDYYGFYRHLFLNKFHYYYDSNSDGNAESIEISDIAQYPEGISPFGLYDMIGNAPEVVKYNNNLWLVGIHPRQEYIGSFCANNGSMFDEDDYNIHAVGLSIGHGSSYNLYGLRLARTTQ